MMDYDYMEMKRCSKCGELRPVSSFYKRGESNRLRSHCKDCISNRAQSYFQEHKQEYDERGRKWAKNNLDRHREIGRNSYAKHIDERKEAASRYYYANREKELARRQKQRDENRELYRRYWRESNKRHRKRCASNYRNYMAHKLGAEGCYTETEWLELCHKYDNKCLHCGTTRDLTRDHIVPLTQGGSNRIGNIQPLCRSCNSKKNNRTIDFRPDAYFRDWT